MKCFPKLTTAAVALTSALATSCTSYSIHPEAKSIAFPARLRTPIPIQVAIARSNQSFPRDVGDQAIELSRRLDQSGLFEAAYYPIPPTARPSATMELSVDRTIRGPNLGRLVGLFASLLTIKLKCDFQVEGKLVLLKGTEVIKTYSAQGKAVLKLRMDITPEGKSEATQAAAWQMQAWLIEQLVRDREFLTQELKASP